ncbi:universal stress protein [Pricia sp. S334]|uniref:Universal stress protein n=1 Tax=Pricia mediterranea TaxID=3076079 RepID=A0ABU3L1C7_9FLAO|nr:universal stress protein [Pricia sp. S334]MDT7827530.1 universal stress protein [Pricia sp. S334]
MKHILVALDLSKMDESLIRYASFMAKTFPLEKVFFVHNIKKYELSELFSEQLKDIDLDKVVGDELNEKVEALFEAEMNWEVLISEDPYTESLINYIVNKFDIDVVLLGNKSSLKSTGTVSGKLLRLLKCDLLAVPKNAETAMKEIWVGTDFSQRSKKALRTAQTLQHIVSAKLTAAHVFNVPIHFSPYLTTDSMASKIERHVTDKCTRFIQNLEHPEGIRQRIIPGREPGIANSLITHAQRAGADLLVVTDKGNNPFSNLLIGSVTEDLFNQISDIPLWIAK